MAIPLSVKVRERALTNWRIRQVRRAGIHVGLAARVIGKPIVEVAAGSSVFLGDRTVLVSLSEWTALGVSRPVIIRTLRPGASITIGSDVGLSGTTICSASSITLGDRILIGADGMIVDTDFHEVDVIPRRYLPTPEPKPEHAISIGDDVFIGARSIILKGSRIGAGAVIAAGSVVSGDIPPGTVAGGVPARPLRMVSDTANG